MPDPLPADIQPGATLRDPSCHVCGHAHHLADCDWCPCSGDVYPGY